MTKVEVIYTYTIGLDNYTYIIKKHGTLFASNEYLRIAD